MYRIVAGDYRGVGEASSGLKGLLKRVGAEPAAVRRAMIAAYEAESNVAIHSVGGEMRVRLDDGVLEVEVVDGGPGIPDIELAMREGYSTAPPEARELGFGAGMGLANIKRNSDRFDIESGPGRGTRLRFTIFFAAQAAAGGGLGAVAVVAGRCRGCLRCLHACPTEALRVRGRTPHVLEHLCIGCGACIAACTAGALAVKGLVETLPEARGAVLVAPAALLVQLGLRVGPQALLKALGELGFGEVRVTEGWERALAEAVARFAREEAKSLPVISPACPAVVSLIEMRFPSLLGHLAPFVSAGEAARAGVAGRDAVVVAGCPAQCSALAGPSASPARIVAPAAVMQAVMRLVADGGHGAADADAGRGTRRARPEEPAREVLRVTGLRHVIAVLEAAENGQLADAAVIEPWACRGGCFGSPLLREEAAIACWRWERAKANAGCGLRNAESQTAQAEARVAESQMAAAPVAVRRERAFAARRGLRLDEDLGRAIAKLGEMDRLLRQLPGTDCGACGAPSCRALAEDVVLGRARGISECRMRTQDAQSEGPVA